MSANIERHLRRRRTDRLQDCAVRILRHAQPGVRDYSGRNESVVTQLFNGGAGAVFVRGTSGRHDLSTGGDVLSLYVSTIRASAQNFRIKC